MKRIVLISLSIIVCVLVLFGCEKKESVSEVPESKLNGEFTVSEEIEQEKNPVVLYFQNTGNKDGDNFIIERQIGKDMSAIWRISEKHPEIVSCHMIAGTALDCYMRYYLDNDIISYNCDANGSMGSKKVVYSSFSLVDATSYHEGDEISIFQVLIDGKKVDSSSFGDTKVFTTNAKFFIQTFYEQLKEFGLPENANNKSKARDLGQMVAFLPAEDECTKLIEGGSEKESLIPDEYKEDAAALDLYDAVKKGDTEYLLTVLGEADSIKNVRHNKFSEYVNRSLGAISFYDATELEQNFLEMYAILGQNNAQLIDTQEIKAVYASGYSQDGSGNADHIIGTGYTVARCVIVQTEFNNWFLFTNQLVGSINTYAKENVAPISAPEINNGQFEFKVFDSEEPFTFKKVEDPFCTLEMAIKAYQVGQLINEFNNEYVAAKNNYYRGFWHDSGYSCLLS